MTIAPGETVGPYRIIEQLGSGGMATVFKGYHPALDRYVAIKVLHPALKKDAQFFERFKREARIVAKLEHPNIIPVYDFSEHENEPYLVMRFVEGATLKPHLDGRLLSPHQILDLMRPVCRAVAYAHNQGVLHRDLKPSNIMVDRDGHIFVADFGLARMVQAGESTLSQDMLVGTPQYISPEQAQGASNLDNRSDIYALGVILFEMLTGRVPFSADTPFATIHDHIYTPLPLPSTINPKIDPAAERLLLKALAKNPADRFATTEALLQALETTLAGPISITRVETMMSPHIVAAPATAPLSPGKAGLPWWAWGGAIALALGLAAGLLVGAWQWRANHLASASDKAPPVAQVADVGQPFDGGQVLPVNNNQADTPQVQSSNETPSGSNEIVTRLEAELANDPHNTELQLQLGQAYIFNGQSEDALALFEQAAAATPNSPLPYAGQALALLDLGQDEAAKQAIDQALALNQANPAAQLANAVYLARQGNRREALRQLRDVFQSQAGSNLDQERAQKVFELLTQ